MTVNRYMNDFFTPMAQATSTPDIWMRRTAGTIERLRTMQPEWDTQPRINALMGYAEERRDSSPDWAAAYNKYLNLLIDADDLTSPSWETDASYTIASVGDGWFRMTANTTSTGATVQYVEIPNLIGRIFEFGAQVRYNPTGGDDQRLNGNEYLGSTAQGGGGIQLTPQIDDTLETVYNAKFQWTVTDPTSDRLRWALRLLTPSNGESIDVRAPYLREVPEQTMF